MDYNSYLGTVKVQLFFKPKQGAEKELSYFLEKFTYVYAEDGPDTCTLIINQLTADAPDLPEFQENAAYRVIWGYIKGSTKERKIYVKDIKWEFDKNGRRVTLECADKSSSLRQTKTKEIHEETTLPELTQKVADKHGLKAYIEVPPSPSSPNRESLIMGITDWQKRKEASDARQGKKKQGDFRASLNIPQANRTDAHILKKVGLKEAGGQWIPETRDDTITLKRRNFGKTPYKSYQFMGGTGELFSFSPETKNNSKLGTAINSMFSAWNAEKKEFIQGMAQANATQYEQQINNLAKWMKDSGFIPKTYKVSPDKQSEKLLGIYQLNTAKSLLSPSTNVGQKVDESTQTPFVGSIILPVGGTFNRNYGSTYPIDNTARPTIMGQRSVTGEELKKLITDVDQAATGELHDPHSDNPEDAFANANNPRENSDLKRNPATALIWGDPNIETGEIVTINNVGAKYSGNYYSLKSTHDISEGSGYTTALELARNGNNIKASSNEAAAKKAGRAVNTEIGQDRRTERRKKIRTSQNRR